MQITLDLTEQEAKDIGSALYYANPPLEDDTLIKWFEAVRELVLDLDA